MTEQQFCYWLQGFAEVSHQAPTDEQWKIIQDHLQLVFRKETPSYKQSSAPLDLSLHSDHMIPPQVIC